MTPNSQTAALIRTYAAAAIADGGYDEDAPAPAILTAITQALTADEACDLGRALLARSHALSDAPYRIGGEMCDPRLAEIAARLGWAA